MQLYKNTKPLIIKYSRIKIPFPNDQIITIIFFNDLILHVIPIKVMRKEAEESCGIQMCTIYENNEFYC